MSNAKILLSFDVEEFDIPLEYGAKISWQDQLKISHEGCCNILDLLEAESVKATFFITVSFAVAYPELIMRMVDGGHEIASHGMAHSSFCEADLFESRQRLESLSGVNVSSFRMARLAPVEKEAIAKAGYNCESSINPIWLPGRYNNRHLPATPYLEEAGFWQFPISTVFRGLRFPLFWLSYKNLPLWLYLPLAKRSLKQYKLFNLYIHPWEFSQACQQKRWKLPSYITRHAGPAYIKRLKKLITTLKKEGTFSTFQEAISEKIK